ncbi:MAG: 30S ribosomal protein S1 [Clostridiaceae bacterium]
MEDMSMKDFMEEIEGSMKKLSKGELVKGEIISVADDMLVVNIGHMRDAFIPKNKAVIDETINLKDVFKAGDEIEAYIENPDDEEGKIILSKTKADSERAWISIAETFEKGKTIKITVKNVVKGGVIGSVNGLRGFIPASQISLTFVSNLDEYLGKELEVKVIELDRSKNKIVLSRKEIEKEIASSKKEELWAELDKKYKVGEIVEGTVAKFINVGAFVRLEDGVEGLVHISEISEDRVTKISDVLEIGAKVKVKILNIDVKAKRISLSIKDAVEGVSNSEYLDYVDNSEASTSLGDLLKNFKFD